MGQCKSKGLEEGAADPNRQPDNQQQQQQAGPRAGRAKANKRRWRKSKGYSLSASMERDLHLEEAESSTLGRRKKGPVLVSYSLRQDDRSVVYFFAGGQSWSLGRSSTQVSNLLGAQLRALYNDFECAIILGRAGRGPKKCNLHAHLSNYLDSCSPKITI